MKNVLGIHGFFAYITVVFLNAFIDLGHKIVVQNTVFKVYDGTTQIMLTAVVNALILLPFILLFLPSGFISDKYPKNQVMKAAAWAAVGLTLGVTACYYQGWFIAAFAMTFLLAVQSAFYSPAKYGFIKLLVGKERLGEGNGAVQATTIIAILLGTFAYSILFEARYDPLVHHDEAAILGAIAPLGWVLVANSLVQLFFAYRIPQLEQRATDRHFDWPGYLTGSSFKGSLRPAVSRPVIMRSIVGLTMFWSISQVMLATFPAFAKETLGETNTVMIQGTLAASGIGIMLGSLVAGRWSRHHIETGLIPIGAAGITLGLCMIPQLGSQGAHVLNFLFIGTMGGFFIVPLNALIQFHAGDREMGQVLAANNLIQNIGMLSFLVLTVALSSTGASAVLILSLLIVVAFFGSLYTVYTLPYSLVRFLLVYLISRRYKVRVQGMRNLTETNGVLLLGNHISWLDWGLVQIASPRPIHFVMAKNIYQLWYLNWFFRIGKVVPIGRGASAQQALEAVAKLLDEGEVVCLFPEGTISRTGHLATFRKGFERAAALTRKDCVIVPFYIGGMWGSQFSRASAKLRGARNAGTSRDIIVAFGTPLPISTDAEMLKHRVFDLSIEAWSEFSKSLPGIPQAWIRASRKLGSDMAIRDAFGRSLSGSRALAGGMVLSRRLRRLNPRQNVGLLFPTSMHGMLANMAALMAGKTVVNLNFTADGESLCAAVMLAELDRVFTSREVIKRLGERGVDLQALLQRVEVHYLEDISAGIGRAERRAALVAVKLLPAMVLEPLCCRRTEGSEIAAILFTSGSEGRPRGVMLSHRNIMANIKQASDVLNMEEHDVLMAQLPLFHAFGLTVGQFLPLVEGLPVICHPDPTDALGVAKAVARYHATVLCATSTFLRLYIKHPKVHPLMLDPLRVVIAGAEKLSADVRDAFKLKFHKDVMEGYGTTETAPVASVNLPDQLDTDYWSVQQGNKAGSVGMPLPGTSFRVVDPDSGQERAVGEAGRIMIGGPQVMVGYLKDHDGTAQVIQQAGGVRWYVTGDKGFMDEDGFLHIVDRYSRFAVIAGESVSLGNVEHAVRRALAEPTLDVAAVSVPDARKGERIVLLCGSQRDPDELLAVLRHSRMNPLWIPSVIVPVSDVPKLGSGKIDFGRARERAAAFLAEREGGAG